MNVGKGASDSNRGDVAGPWTAHLVSFTVYLEY